jgi:hypothetical protein
MFGTICTHVEQLQLIPHRVPPMYYMHKTGMKEVWRGSDFLPILALHFEGNWLEFDISPTSGSFLSAFLLEHQS